MRSGGLRTETKKQRIGTDEPLVSVITAVYNGETFIETTINSVLNQSYKNIEYIIIDGGSTDKTIDIIEKYQKWIDYWISEPDKGIADAFNKGIAISNGDIVGILNADDWYEPDAVEAIVSNLKPYPAIYSGHMNLWNEAGERIVKLHISRPERLLQTMRVAHPSTFVSRAVYNSVGVFSTEYRIAMDYDFFLRAKAALVEIIILNKVLSNMRLGGISSNIPEILKEELEVKNRNMGMKIRHYAWYIASLSVHMIKRLINSGTFKD